jgi:hypothetical protein
LNDTPVDVSSGTLRNDVQTTHHGYLISSADGVAYADEHQIKLGRREGNTKGQGDPFWRTLCPNCPSERLNCAPAERICERKVLQANLFQDIDRVGNDQGQGRHRD